MIEPNRIERVKIGEIRGVAKVAGTVVTFAGALVMTLYKGPIIDFIGSRSHAGGGGAAAHAASDKHWVTGTLFILIGCCAWSAFYILQVSSLTEFITALREKERVY